MTDTNTEDLTLKTVADAIEAKNIKTDELIESKATTEALESVKADSDTQIKAITEKLEVLEAKALRPAFLETKEQEMENKQEELRTFVTKGIEGIEALRAKAANTQISVDSQGGYALPAEVASTILQLQHETSPIRGLVGSIQTGTTDYSQLVSLGGAASGWVGETDPRPNTDSPELGKISAVFGEVYANPKAYQHVLEDAFFNVEGWVTGEVSREFNDKEGVAFLRGDGNKKPIGLMHGLGTSSAYLNGDKTRDFGKFQVLKSGHATTLGANSDAVINKMRDVVLATKTGYRPRAKWMMNQNTHAMLVDMKTSDGEYFLQRNITEAAATRLLGYDIVINDDMADVKAGEIPVAFGDFAAGYSIIDLVGVSMLRDPYSTKGAIEFYTRKRVGSMITNTEAVKFIAIEA